MPRVVGALFMTMNSWAPWRTARTRREERKIEIRAQKKKKSKSKSESGRCGGRWCG